MRKIKRNGFRKAGVSLGMFAMFGHTNQFSQSPDFSQFFFIVAVLGWAGVVLTLFVKKRYEN